jgi:hypothetical protein
MDAAFFTSGRPKEYFLGEPDNVAEVKTLRPPRKESRDRTALRIP